MSKLRKKPVVIDATQFFAGDPATHEHVNYGWPKERGDERTHRLDGVYWIPTLEGEHIVSEGDWVITGVKGEHYPCKPDIFAATYDAVE